jgi:hypothetical protein
MALPMVAPSVAESAVPLVALMAALTVVLMAVMRDFEMAVRWVVNSAGCWAAMRD